MDLYETEFVNRRGTVVIVEENGRQLLRLEPGETQYVESVDPRTSYSPWSRITFKDNGKVTLDENPAWHWPYPDQLMLVALNEASEITQGLIIDQVTWHCFPNVPRLVPVNWDSSMAFTERLRFIETKERVKDGDFIKTLTKTGWVKELRSKREIKSIRKRLEDAAVAAAVAKARQDLDIRFRRDGVAEEADR